MSNTPPECEKFPPLPPAPERPLLGYGAMRGPVRAVCAAATAIGCGVVAAKPPALPDWLRPAPDAGAAPLDAYGAPLVVPAPGALALFAVALVALWAVRR